MRSFVLELRIILQSRLASGALALLLVLASLAVWNGYRAVDTQTAALARLAAAHQEDHKAFVAKFSKDGKGSKGNDSGSAAYYGFHLTRDPPPPLAFIAFGQRDLQPPALRVRMLGLHSQLYESENFNPELVVLGKFDFAFVLIYLVPLFVIALAHDWVTAERESGRLRLLMSLPLQSGRLWRRRAWLRYGLVMAAVLLPMLVGLLPAMLGFAGTAAVGPAQAAGVIAVAALYTAFWIAAAALVGTLARSSSSAAATLLGVYVVITLLLPTLANAAINRLVPVAKGVELAMAQRQEVHQGWDLPKTVVMEKFFRTHPEWQDTPPVTGRFHWKWYYAMHQVGDEAVAAQAADYRQSMMQREQWTARTAWLLPAAAAQLALHRLADTDLQAQLAYRDSIAGFHAQLRRYFYPLVFLERRFGSEEVRGLPVFQPRQHSGSMSMPMLGALLLATIVVAVACSLALRRVSPLARSGFRTV